jgi:hypothetical protein
MSYCAILCLREDDTGSCSLALCSLLSPCVVAEAYLVVSLQSQVFLDLYAERRCCGAAERREGTKARCDLAVGTSSLLEGDGA